MTSDHSAASLAGIHILDLSRVLAAPYATMALGDLGAEIIKIERPGLGDETRQWGPPFLEGQSAYFLSANRNKKSCEVDLGDHRVRHGISPSQRLGNRPHRPRGHLFGVKLLRPFRDCLLPQYALQIFVQGGSMVNPLRIAAVA